MGRTLTLSGPKAWSTQEVIELCERLSDSNAKVRPPCSSAFLGVQRAGLVCVPAAVGPADGAARTLRLTRAGTSAKGPVRQPVPVDVEALRRLGADACPGQLYPAALHA